jgi:hypothetical protein
VTLKKYENKKLCLYPNEIGENIQERQEYYFAQKSPAQHEKTKEISDFELQTDKDPNHHRIENHCPE